MTGIDHRQRAFEVLQHLDHVLEVVETLSEGRVRADKYAATIVDAFVRSGSISKEEGAQALAVSKATRGSRVEGRVQPDLHVRIALERSSSGDQHTSGPTLLRVWILNEVSMVAGGSMKLLSMEAYLDQLLLRWLALGSNEEFEGTLKSVLEGIVLEDDAGGTYVLAWSHVFRCGGCWHGVQSFGPLPGPDARAMRIAGEGLEIRVPLSWTSPPDVW